MHLQDARQTTSCQCNAVKGALKFHCANLCTAVCDLELVCGAQLVTTLGDVVYDQFDRLGAKQNLQPRHVTC